MQPFAPTPCSALILAHSPLIFVRPIQLTNRIVTQRRIVKSYSIVSPNEVVNVVFNNKVLIPESERTPV